MPDKSANKSANLGPDLHLEVNKKYELIISSQDVIHSFFVYDLGIKQDAVPGREPSVFVVPQTTGTFAIRCAQFCGPSHYQMQGQNVIVT